MTQLMKQHTTWAPLTEIRPSHLREGKVVVTAPDLKKRYLLPPQAISNLLLAEINQQDPDSITQQVTEQLSACGLLNRAAPQVDAEGVRHWKERNWGISLNYYLWTRDVDYADKAATYQDAQQGALQQYWEEDPMPAPRQVAPEKASALPDPLAIPEVDLGWVMQRRASVGKPIERPLDLQVLSSLLWYTTETPRRHRDQKAESSPLEVLKSFGSALNLHFAAYDVPGLKPGVYAYDLATHTIELVHADDGSLRETMSDLLVGQSSPLTGNCTFLYLTDLSRYQWIYRHERALRNLYAETGRIAHRTLLLATAFGLSTHISPAVKDTPTLKLLQADPLTSQVLYTITVG